MTTSPNYRHASPALSAAIDRFVSAAFGNAGSIFSPGKQIWTSDNLRDLHTQFVQNPDLTKTSFLVKFEKQLKGATPDVLQLAAELVFAHLLTPYKMSAKKKREVLDAVLSWSPQRINVPVELLQAFEQGLVNDMSFFQARPYHLQYLIEVTIAWRGLSPVEQARFRAEPLAFKAFARSIHVKAGQPMREILYYFVHPSYFEVITSRDHKEIIAKRFRDEVESPASDIDELLNQIRTKLSLRYGPDYDYYGPELRVLWQPEDDQELGSDEIKGDWQQFMHWLERFRASADFDRFELGYKREVGKRLAAAKQALLDNDPDWPVQLRAAFGPPNNLTTWRLHDKFLKWVDAETSAAGQLLQLMWTQLDAVSGITDLSTGLPQTVVKGAGMRAALGSFLQMARGTDNHPMFRPKVFKAAYKLAAFDEGGRHREEGAIYREAIEFLDRVVAESTKSGGKIHSRLEAQGAVWALLNWRDRRPDWSQAEWEQMNEFRGGGAIDNGEDDPPLDPPIPLVEPATSLSQLAEELLLAVGFLEEAVALLRDKRQIILYGPPGTGKTFVAQRLAACLAGDVSRTRLVQFHPSYAYEDFVEGYRPAIVGNSPGFKLTPGPLMDIAKAAQAEPDKTFVLVIDEINRANLAKVFGEMYFLLEYRGERVRLQYSSEPFALPPNLWIIGTMNTADRSIAIVDAALRRRFFFLEFFPDREPVKGLLSRWLSRHLPHLAWVADAVELANTEMADRHLAIGPSHFMKSGLTEEWVERIWRHSILPHIEERYFAEPERAEAFYLAKVKLRMKQPGTAP